MDDDLDRARVLVRSIRIRALLSAETRAYLNWVEGCLAEDDGDLQEAQRMLELAVNGNIRTGNDRCRVTATLARVLYLQGETDRARWTLREAERRPHGAAAEQFLEEVRRVVDQAK